MQGATFIVDSNLLKCIVRFVSTVFGAAHYFEMAQFAKDYVIDVLKARVVFDNLRRAEGALDLSVYLLLSILHENGRGRVGLGHFGLSLLKPWEHMVGQNNGFQLALDVIAVFTCKHIDLALVQPKLTDVCLEEKDIGTLHAWVKNLSSGHVIRIISSHNCTATFNAREVVPSSNVHHGQPVFIGPLVDLISSPHKLHVSHVHPYCLPNLNEILSNFPNLLKIASHFVI
mmetsp:Transcript_33843/g.54847  ORF Transcript_33843/g.54847 Transcript_33843/m.54847 type:complete len:229 (-) Transcript_33843:622-1308(-)